MSGRNTSNQDLWPKWMWVAVPVLVVVVVAGLWWAIFSPGTKGTSKPTPMPTIGLTRPQPTQRPTGVSTLSAVQTTITPTQQILTTLPTFTPTQQVVTTPTGVPTAVATGLAVGSKVVVTGTGGTGLNMRAGPGTNQARIKTLAENTKLEIIGGPKEANGFVWWQVRDDAGTAGWVVDKYLKPQ